MIIIVTGVAGSGKSTIARTLARKTGMNYVDADDFHSAENKAKMAGGLPLDDADRLPWLNSLHNAIAGWLASSEQVALACSALKRSYRGLLQVDPQNVRFVYLKGSAELFFARLARRKGHYMRESMLASQFAALEEPSGDEAVVCDAGMKVLEIVAFIMASCALPPAKRKK